MAEDALALFAPVPRDLVVELVNGFDRLLLLFQLGLNLRPLRLIAFLQVVKLPLTVVDRNLVSPDLVLGGLEQGLERLGLEEEDFATRLADILVVAELVIPCIGWENDMPGGKNVDLVAVAVVGEVEGPGALSVRRSSDGDLQTKCGSQRTAKARGGVAEGGGSEELRTGRPSENGFPELDFDVSDLIRLEEILATNSRGMGVFA